MVNEVNKQNTFCLTDLPFSKYMSMRLLRTNKATKIAICEEGIAFAEDLIDSNNNTVTEKIV